ncbi:MAG: phospholipid/cholesterol/gamma-HCH transport system substrate-binding protein [Verrucomicrobiales bacterium]|nr:phospholipid/cholesterol/gamma-HCH transport system substrate-binding protein [Verrucomicrobiales bacterium]
MSKPRLELKVGLFVTISLIALALIVMRFSKGAGMFTSTYKIKLRTENVGGVIPGVAVLMAGVPIGNVLTTDLEKGGHTVQMEVKIKSKFEIHGDAVFSIKQSGLLGDRFISVVPGKNEAPILTNNQVVNCEEPFDLQEVARSTAGLMRRVDQTAQQLNSAVARLDTTLLSGETLTNITTSVANFRLLSERTLGVVSNVDNVIKGNSAGLSLAVTNFGTFSAQLNKVARELEETVVSNRTELTAAIKNIENATMKADQLLAEVQSGHGVAGTLIKNEKLSQDVANTLSNLSVFSSNLNQQGLWGVIRKPKHKK